MYRYFIQNQSYFNVCLFVCFCVCVSVFIFVSYSGYKCVVVAVIFCYFLKFLFNTFWLRYYRYTQYAFVITHLQQQ